MQTFLIIIQFAGIIILFSEALYLVNQRPSRQQIRLLLLMSALIIDFTGYLFVLQATTQEQSLQALKFSYLGRPIGVLTMFLFVMEYCKVKLPKWAPAALGALHIASIMLILTCDRHKLYYDSIAFTPVCLIYYGCIVVYGVLMVLACTRRYRQWINEAERHRILAFYAIIAIMLLGWAGHLFDWFGGYDPTLITELISVIILSSYL